MVKVRILRITEMTRSVCIVLIFLLGVVKIATGQIAEQDTLVAYEIAETAPEPVGGARAIYTWFNENLDLQKFARLDTICDSSNGRIIVTFIINEEGNLVQPEIARGIGNPYDEYCLDLVSRIPVEWVPGTYGGKPVKVRMAYPFRFCGHHSGQPGKW